LLVQRLDPVGGDQLRGDVLEALNHVKIRREDSLALLRRLVGIFQLTSSLRYAPLQFFVARTFRVTPCGWDAAEVFELILRCSTGCAVSYIDRAILEKRP
jgi:hypothetical protein